VVAKTDVAAWFIERDDFRAMVASRDAGALELQRAITRVLARKLHALNAKLATHPAEEDRAPRGEPPAQIDLSGAAAPRFEWRAFLPLLAFFQGFDAYEIDELIALARPLELARGQWLFAAGESAQRCFLVLRGAVEVLARVGGLERRVALAGPGELVGYLALVERVPHTASARVREHAALLEFPGAGLLALYEGRSGASVRLQRAIHGTLLRSLARSNGQLTRLIAAARLRGAQAEGRALEAARGSQLLDLVEQAH
jgi:CRP-like cAMP-binding protein